MSSGIALLLVVTLVWGTTFPLLRAAAVHLSGVEVSALRFLVAGLCMVPFALRASRQAWRDGILLGFIAISSYIFQAVGLEFISSNRSAFITSLNVLMVPFLAMFMGGRLSFQVVGAASLACAGIGLMSWGGGSNVIGDGATVCSALTYAIYILMLSRRSPLHASRTLAATQIVAMAMMSNLLLVATHWHRDALPMLLLRARPAGLSIVYLGVVASAGMIFLQAVGQRSVSAQKAALIYAMEPVFAAFFGWLWLREAMSGRAIVGAALVVFSVILGEWRFAPAKTLASDAP